MCSKRCTLRFVNSYFSGLSDQACKLSLEDKGLPGTGSTIISSVSRFVVSIFTVSAWMPL